MAVTAFTLPYVGTPPYFSGTSTSSLVPNVFPVAIDGRPYMVDQKSGKFQRGYEQRVRDSQDISTAPGEAAINPGGLWRRGQDSWHYGAGQQYADTAESKDYMFYRSRGINPWTKGQLSLLNDTKRSLESANTNLFLCSVMSSGGTDYLYVADGNTVKYSTNPYDTSPTWTSVTTDAPAGVAITAMETNGTNIFIAYTNNDIYYTTPGSSSVTFFYPTGGSGTGKTYTGFAYAKGWGWASVDNAVYIIGVASGSHTVFYTHPDTSLRWVGFAAGQTAVYGAAFSGEKSIIYKFTLNGAASISDQPIAALDLPVGEVVTSISSYLSFILIGTNKGVRYCNVDNLGNLVAGPIIPTSGNVYDFVAEDKYVWYGWSNYDGTYGGLGRLDLSVFTSTNTPAFATDLMYASSNAVKSVSTFQGRRVFTISGVGVIIEDTTKLVSTGEIETGTWRWGIPDRKFVAKIDTRSTPLSGSITSYLQIDDGEYQAVGTWDSTNDTENSFDGSDERAIEASFKFALHRNTTTLTSGPTFTRWMARAYVAPFRSQFFVIPILLHKSVKVRDKEYFYDVDEHQSFFDDLIESPRIITLQISTFTHTVIVDDVAWESSDAHGTTWSFNGTLVVTLRSVEN